MAGSVALAVYVVVDSAMSLWLRARPERSTSGIVIPGLSVVIMPVLAREKRRVAHELRSTALKADATQTSLCAHLSVIALAGVALNAAFG